MVISVVSTTAAPSGAAAPAGDGAGAADRLVAHAITVDFDGLRALDAVDVELSRGEILGLIGPNGAGKTTLVNVLTGFQAPTAGALSVDGRPATGWAPARVARAGVSRTFQSGRYFRNLTVWENVEVGAVGLGVSRRAARARVERALERTRLSDRRHADAASLSNGQERRLGIARALAMEPRYLLLDEPAAGLNDAESAELVALVAGLPAESGCGVLVIEHDMEVIMTLCERLQVLDHGATIALGAPDDVRRDPAVVEAYLGRAAHGQPDAADPAAADASEDGGDAAR